MVFLAQRPHHDAGLPLKRRETLAVFNRGRISRLAIGRADVSRVALSAETQTNWMPRTLGAMSLRPGLGYIGTCAGDGALIPFVAAVGDVAILELTASAMRVWVGGTTLLTRTAVSTAITNGAFTTDLTGWTDADDAGGTSAWDGGAMSMFGNGYASGKRQQLVSVSGGDAATVHALRIVITSGPVILRVGSTAGADNIFRQAVLRTGTHSIAFTPGGSFYIEFSSSLRYPSLVDSVAIEAAGTVSLPTPWSTADLCKSVRWAQSNDVVFCAGGGVQQRRIERRDNGSWSVVLYQANDGPFLAENVENITLTPSGVSGSITLTASRPIFYSGHVGALFRLSSQGQEVGSDLTASLTFSDSIRVIGVGASRNFFVTISGTWAGTLTLQRSVDEESTWEDYASYTGNAVVEIDDGLDNVIAYYRIGFKAAAYTSGTATVGMSYVNGSVTGIVRVVVYTDAQTVTASVISRLGRAAATEVWAEGEWSDTMGWPTAVAIWEGRLWWAGNGKAYGSVSDSFSSFNADFEGDAGPIVRRIGDGAAADVDWLLPLQRLISGTAEAEYAVRSTSLDEPVTPTNYNAKAIGLGGVSDVPAVSTGTVGYFVDRTGSKVMELDFDAQRYDYTARDMTILVPEIGESEFVRLGVQMAPDMRVHAVREDGTVAVMVRDAAEDVLCWVDVETDGDVEDVVVMPGLQEDRVFYRVKRTIGGVDVRYLERWALVSNCVGGTLNRQVDSFITGAGAVSGLSHLNGKTVAIWGDGADLGTGVVSAGAVSGMTSTSWVAGLPYEAEYRSAKLAGQTALGLSMTQRSRIERIGLILADTHYQGLEFGPDFDTMDSLPLVEDGAATAAGTVWESYDRDMIEFPGDWATDNRICLTAASPRPATVLAAVVSIDRQDAD